MGAFLGWSLFVFIVAISTLNGGKTQVVLLPDHDGTVGQVEVVTDAGGQLLSEAGQMTIVKDSSKPPSDTVVLDQKEIEAVFSNVLNAEPIKPKKFILYFSPGGVDLTAESIELISEIVQTINKRNSKYVSIYGHSDRVGSEDYNITLSTKRAEVVKDILLNRNVSSEIMETASHGEGNPLVDTPDGVAEPRNRRVEIVVR